MINSKGRVKILSDLFPTGDIEQDKKIIPKIIEITLPYHLENVCVMDKLEEYYYNNTSSILKKPEKNQQKNIDNKIAINYAYMAVTNMNAHCFANPLTFSAEGDDVDKVESLNKAMKADKYKEKSDVMQLNSAITGLGYRYIEPPTKEQIKNGIYFVSHCDLSPKNTYCVYSNNLNKEKICAITYRERKFFDEELNSRTMKVYTVFTKWHKWEFYKTRGKWEAITQHRLDENGNEIFYQAYELPYKKIPIVENWRKADGTGDFEMGIDLIDAVNNLASSRLDDVQQAVDYILSFRDIDIWTEGALEDAIKARDKGILGFKSIEGASVQPEIKILNVPQNQSQVQALQDFYCNKTEEILYLPNRETNSSGGDNGVAVEARNGTRSMENYAGLVISSAIDTEQESLEVILAICNNIDSCPFKGLKANQVHIQDNRNRTANLTAAANVTAILKGVGFNDYDAIRIPNLDPNPKTVADRNEEFKNIQQERELEFKKKEQTVLTNNIGQNNNDTTSGDAAV